MSYDPGAVEAKWQKRWADAKLFEAEPDGREKFFILFAYPGVSGYLHLGHMRGYTYADVIARYRRMGGFNVIFPVGSHASGNIAISFAKKVERGDKAHLEYLRANGCPEAEIPNLKDPKEVVRFFNGVYMNEYWRRFGFSADFRRFTCTIFEDYMRFIQWQFRKLKDRGLLFQKEYYSEFCPQDGPVAVDPSETDLQKGGKAEKVEYALLKFRLGDRNVLAATLRPETVFGQTNFWVNPGVRYVEARVDGEKWIVSRECAGKLKWQKDSVEVVGEVDGRELIGKRCLSPYIGRELLMLPAPFCDPDVGTGLVTSVPSDAPFDWVALRELQGDEEGMRAFGLDPDEVRAIEPIYIIDTKGYGKLPAVEITAQMGIARQDDPKLEEATKLIYKAGFHGGRMNARCGRYAGMPVAQAKEDIKKEMVAMGIADVLYDLSEEVVCRCGARVVIKKIKDQWFIDYGNRELTDASKEQAARMTICPREYGENMPNVLEWFKERACVRMGNWLGTPFPFDPRWTIEPISDSTLYPAYYVVSKYVNSGELRAEQLTDAFFDLVFLGKGAPEEVSRSSGIDPTLLERIVEDFRYWYPVDINLGGKEHMTVHFPVFLMNHVAVLPENLWPRGIFTNWWITWKGGMRISKSKGGAVPIPNAAERFTVDGMRLYYSHSASPFVDVEWDDGAVENCRSRLGRVWHMLSELRALRGEGETAIDGWLLSSINRRLRSINAALDGYDLREAANEVFFGLESDVRWYLRRGGHRRQTIDYVLDRWTRAMAPFTPHLAEEFWELMGGDGFVSAARYPLPEEEKVDARAESAERFLEDVMADVSEITKVTDIKPTRVHIYTAPRWKVETFRKAAGLAKTHGLQMNALMRNVLAEPNIKAGKDELARYAMAVTKELSTTSAEELERLGDPIDERGYLEGAREFLERELGCEVVVRSADEENLHDPQRKSARAAPWKPAIYIE